MRSSLVGRSLLDIESVGMEPKTRRVGTRLWGPMVSLIYFRAIPRAT